LLAAGVAKFERSVCIPAGCAACDNTGYKDRIGIFEALVIDEQMRGAIRLGLRDEEVRNLARSRGMRLMQEEALEKVKQGVTTLEEVVRVVPFENLLAQRCGSCGKSLAPAFMFCPYCGSGAGQQAAPAGPEGLFRHSAEGGLPA